MEKLTPDKAAVVRLLRDIIDGELDKPESDMALVGECSAFLGELLDGQFPMTENEIEKRLDLLKKKAAREKRLVRLTMAARRIAVCAAVILAVGISSLGIYANYPAVRSWIVGMFSEPAAQSNTAGSITQMTVGETLIYTDMETLIDKEGLEGILYPKSLPEDLEVSSVVYHGKETDYSRISYNFTDASVSFSIGLSCGVVGEPEEGDRVESAGELTFVIRTFEDVYSEDSDEVLYHASAADEEGRYYIIESTSLDKVMRLIHQFSFDLSKL